MEKFRINARDGFAPIVVIIAALVIAAAGGGYWYIKNVRNLNFYEEVCSDGTRPEHVCTQSYPENCWTVCSDGSKPALVKKSVSVKPVPKSPQTVELGADISGWQTYRNEEYGFEVKYPAGWTDIGRYKSEPAMPGILFDIGLGDRANPFRQLRVFVLSKKPQIDDLGSTLEFPGGIGTRFGNEYFITEKNGSIIELWHTHEKRSDEFFSKILSTFKFIR